MSRTLLIDGDIILYLSCCGQEKKFDWDGTGETVTYADAEITQSDIKSRLSGYLSKLNADDLIVCLSDPSHRYFRHDVLPTYKHNRSSGSKPVLREEMRAWIESEYPCQWWPELEADDVLGILATKPHEGERIIVTGDKDLKQIPGRHYNPRHGLGWWIHNEEADWFFYMQVLTGDPTDGFKGCPGIGPKKASKALTKDLMTLGPWPTIVEMYEAKGLTEEDALQQARCARILRYGDYDIETGEVKLWSPNAS